MPLPNNTSQTARLLVDPPGYAVGWQERLILPDPAVGAQWLHTVDGRYYERLVTCRYAFATSAVVANRFPSVQLKDTDGKVVTVVPGGQNVAASATANAYLTVGAPAYAQGTSGNVIGFIPDLLVPPGWSWGSVTGNMDAGDAFTGVLLVVQRFPNDTQSIPVAG